MTAICATGVTEFGGRVLMAFPQNFSRLHYLSVATGSCRVAVYSSLKKLEKDGFIELGRHNNLIHLTQKGRDVIAAIRERDAQSTDCASRSIRDALTSRRFIFSKRLNHNDFYTRELDQVYSINTGFHRW